MNLETLIYSLVVALVSGLTFIAYKHPVGYKKIYTLLIPVSFVPVIIILSYNLGALYSSIRSIGNDLLEKPDEKISLLSHNITRMNESLDYILLSAVIGFVVIGYLMFLHKLPVILETNSNEENT